MTNRVDAVVVGGGPAGASTAYHLARAGRSVVVIEGKVFPRDKTCGDGLTPRAITALDQMGLADEVHRWQSVRGMRLHGLGRTRSAEVPRTRQWDDHGVVVPRRVLDEVVLGNAESAGAQVRYGTKALRPAADDGRVSGVVVSVAGREETIRARWLVCAEGAAGTIRRQLGRVPNPHYPMGVALREYRPAGSEQLDWFDIHFDLREPWGLLPGYGWAFPVDDGTVNIGVGLLQTPDRRLGVRLHDHLDRFAERLADKGLVEPGAPGWSRRGGRLFMGSSVWPPHGAGYVLVGDAAGMINPATGEGIAYAYETGEIAARHAHAAMEAGEAQLPGYQQELHATYGRYYRLGRGVVTLMMQPWWMEQLVRQVTAGDRRRRFAARLLLNLDDRSMRNLDQYGMRCAGWVASVARWAPRPPTFDRRRPPSADGEDTTETEHVAT